MYRLAFTAKRKEGGTASFQREKVSREGKW
jgi:hypothetical protein